MTHRAIWSVLVAIGLAVITTGGATAKLDSTLSAAQAGPGDTVALTTGSNSEGVSQGGQPVPVYMFAGRSDQPPWNCSFWDAPSAKAAGATLLGSLTWDHATGVGRLAFKVPDVPQGSYAIAVLAPNASPGCWPEATLTVAAKPPATDALSLLTANLAWLVLAAAAAAGALVLGVRSRWHGSAQ